MVDTLAQTCTEVRSCRYRRDDNCRFADVCPGDGTRIIKPKGNSIVLPGVKPSNVYLMQEGVVGLFRTWASGEETVVALYTPGGIFGLGSIMNEWEPRLGQFLGHLRALTAVSMCRLHPENFLSYACKDQSRARGVVKLALEQLREAHRMAALPVRRGPDKALAHVLALLAEKASEPCRDGRLISSCFTHQDLADMARLTRATATRALHELCRKGLIDLEQKWIRVPNADKLWAIIEEEDLCPQ